MSGPDTVALLLAFVVLVAVSGGVARSLLGVPMEQSAAYMEAQRDIWLVLIGALSGYIAGGRKP